MGDGWTGEFRECLDVLSREFRGRVHEALRGRV